MNKITSTNYLNSLRVHFLPFVVWLGTVAVVITLFSHRSRRYEILGVAQSPVHNIAATCDGRLVSLPVALFDEVKKDQLVAVLNAVEDSDNPQEVISAQMAVVEAEIESLTAQWKAATEQIQSNRHDEASQTAMEVRRLEVDIEQAKDEAMRLGNQLATNRLNLRKMETNITLFRMQVQADANAANMLRLKSLQDEYDILEEGVVNNEELRAAAETRKEKAEQRLAGYRKTLKPDPEMDTVQAQFDKAKEVQRKKLDELQAQLEALKPIELKAPFDGIVSVVQHREGEAIMASAPILTIAKKTPDNIVAYATEDRAGTVREQMKVQLIDRNRTPNALVASHVVYVGPTIEQLPPRLWRNPNVPQYGRPIMIDVPAELKATLVPGAIVGVKGI